MPTREREPLARGGSIAWLISLAENLLFACSAFAFIGGSGVMWPNLAIIVIPSVILLALLLSEPMRRHVGFGRSRLGAGLM